MMPLSKLDMALLTTPPDMISALVAYGAEQMACWVGKSPDNDADFYFHLGGQIKWLTAKAWDRQLAERQTVGVEKDLWE